MSTRALKSCAKSEIYSIINDLAAQGLAVIMISSEMPEVMNMSDRMIVMREGTVSAVLDRSEYTQELILQYAMG